MHLRARRTAAPRDRRTHITKGPWGFFLIVPAALASLLTAGVAPASAHAVNGTCTLAHPGRQQCAGASPDVTAVTWENHKYHRYLQVQGGSAAVGARADAEPHSKSSTQKWDSISTTLCSQGECMSVFHFKNVNSRLCLSDYRRKKGVIATQQPCRRNNAAESFFEEGNKHTGWDLFDLGNAQYLCVAPSRGKYWAKFATKANNKTCIWH